MTRTYFAMLALVGSAGLTACGGSKPVVVVAEPAPPPPPVVETVAAPPPPKLAAVCDATLELDGKLHFPREVEFESGKSTLKNTDNTNKILQCLVDFLAQNKMVTKFRLEGYTDSQGDAAMNQTLSDARAKAVVDWMASHGTDMAKLWAKGYGPKNPVQPNDSPEHMAMNRRVEFHVDEIDGTKANPDRIKLAMNPVVVVVAAAPPAGGVTVTAAVPGVSVTAPSVAVTAPSVAVTAPSVAVSAPSSVSVGIGTGSSPSPKKK